jgi:hypothetical protein
LIGLLIILIIIFAIVQKLKIETYNILLPSFLCHMNLYVNL